MDFKKGDFVEIEFWDHAHEKGKKSAKWDLILCRARGRVHEYNSQKVILQTWESILSDREDYELNAENFVIARKLIVQVKVYRLAKIKKFY